MTDSPTPNGPWGLEGPLHKTAIAVLLLAVVLDLNVPVDASKQASPPQEPSVPPQDKKPDSATDKPQQTNLQLADGTPVRLKFVRKVVSSEVIAGEKIPLEVVEPVLAGKLVAISQHSAQEAIVTMAQASRSMGHRGNLQFKIESIRLADGELVPVRAMKDVKGGRSPVALTGEAGMVAGFVFWPASSLGFLMYARGKNATVPAGAEITAYIAGDIPLDTSKFQDAVAAPQEKNAPQ